MKLRELAYLADEDFDPDVAAHLVGKGWDVRTAVQMGLLGKPDREVLRAAHAAGRAILTHDGDFGWHTVSLGEPCVGIVYVRPGHIRAELTIATLDAVARHDPDVHPPFILVARRHDNDVTIRVRRL